MLWARLTPLSSRLSSSWRNSKVSHLQAHRGKQRPLSTCTPLSPNGSSTRQLPAAPPLPCGAPHKIHLRCSPDAAPLPSSSPFPTGKHPEQHAKSPTKRNANPQQVADAPTHGPGYARTPTPSPPSCARAHGSPAQVPGEEAQHQVQLFNAPSAVLPYARTALQQHDRVSGCRYVDLHTGTPTCLRLCTQPCAHVFTHAWLLNPATPALTGPKYFAA